LDDKEILHTVILIIEQMKEEFFYFNDILIYDTTFGTNKYRWSLFNLDGINNNYENIEFCIAVMH